MDYFKLIEERKSCRAYRPTVIPKEDVEKIVYAGQMAPSAINLQPWHFYVATGGAARRVASCLDPKFKDASVFIVVTEVERVSPIRPLPVPRPLDIGLATMQMTLAAYALGYDSCIVGMTTKEIEQAVSMREGEVLHLVLAVGKQDTLVPLRDKTRLPLEEIATFLD